MSSKNKSGRPLTGDDRYLRGGELQDRLREPGGERLHVGSTTKYRDKYDRIFNTDKTQETE